MGREFMEHGVELISRDFLLEGSLYYLATIYVALSFNFILPLGRHDVGTVDCGSNSVMCRY